jgi:hypothetical protein
MAQPLRDKAEIYIWDALKPANCWSAWNSWFQALFTSQSVTFAAMPYALSMI